MIKGYEQVGNHAERFVPGVGRVTTLVVGTQYREEQSQYCGRSPIKTDRLMGT